jgi:hypothetical protein
VDVPWEPVTAQEIPYTHLKNLKMTRRVTYGSQSDGDSQSKGNRSSTTIENVSALSHLEDCNEGGMRNRRKDHAEDW